MGFAKKFDNYTIFKNNKTNKKTFKQIKIKADMMLSVIFNFHIIYVGCCENDLMTKIQGDERGQPKSDFRLQCWGGNILMETEKAWG